MEADYNSFATDARRQQDGLVSSAFLISEASRGKPRIAALACDAC